MTGYFTRNPKTQIPPGQVLDAPCYNNSHESFQAKHHIQHQTTNTL